MQNFKLIVIPECMQFQTKQSFKLWIPFNIFYLTLWTKGYFDLNTLYVILFIGSILTIKLGQFASNKNIQLNAGEEHISAEFIKEIVLKFSKQYESAIDSIIQIDSIQDFGQKIVPFFIAGMLFNQISFLLTLFLVVNTIFAWYYIKNQLNIDLKQQFDIVYGKVLQKIPNKENLKKNNKNL